MPRLRHLCTPAPRSLGVSKFTDLPVQRPKVSLGSMGIRAGILCLEGSLSNSGCFKLIIFSATCSGTLNVSAGVLFTMRELQIVVGLERTQFQTTSTQRPCRPSSIERSGE